jgi:hypothetical protein
VRCDLLGRPDAHVSRFHLALRTTHTRERIAAFAGLTIADQPVAALLADASTAEAVASEAILLGSVRKLALTPILADPVGRLTGRTPSEELAWQIWQSDMT